MDAFFLVGRVTLGCYFVWSGIKHFKNMQGMVGYAASKGTPMPKVAIPLTGLMLLLGGIGVLLQFQVTIAYTLLIIFLISAAFMIHNFWKATDPMAKMADTIQFQKNIALAAALLMLLAMSA